MRLFKKHHKEKATSSEEKDLLLESGIIDTKQNESLFYQLSDEDRKLREMSRKITDEMFDYDFQLIYHTHDTFMQRRSQFIEFFNGYFSHRLVELIVDKHQLVEEGHEIHLMMMADQDLPKHMYTLVGIDELGNELLEMVINIIPNRDQITATCLGTVQLLAGYANADLSAIDSELEEGVSDEELDEQAAPEAV